MQKYIYTDTGQLPWTLNANQIAAMLGISVGRAYEMMHNKTCPTLKIGRRLVVQREKFLQWIEKEYAA